MFRHPKQVERFRRHVRGKALKPEYEEALIGNSVFSKYKQRMLETFGIPIVVWGVGQYTGAAVGACVWLSVVAGLAACNEDVMPGSAS